jgi:hypothetical protein
LIDKDQLIAGGGIKLQTDYNIWASTNKNFSARTLVQDRRVKHWSFWPSTLAQINSYVSSCKLAQIFLVCLQYYNYICARSRRVYTGQGTVDCFLYVYRTSSSYATVPIGYINYSLAFIVVFFLLPSTSASGHIWWLFGDHIWCTFFTWKISSWLSSGGRILRCSLLCTCCGLLS